MLVARLGTILRAEGSTASTARDVKTLAHFKKGSGLAQMCLNAQNKTGWGQGTEGARGAHMSYFTKGLKHQGQRKTFLVPFRRACNMNIGILQRRKKTQLLLSAEG